MKILSKFTRTELIQFFLSCITIIHLWGVYGILNEIPAFLLYYTLWELISILSYLFAFLFVEAAAVFVIVMLPGLLLPKKITPKRYVPIGFFLVLYSGVFIAVVTLVKQTKAEEKNMLIGLIVLFVFSIVGLIRSERFYGLVTKLMDQISVLAVLFLLIDGVGILIVIGRNIIKLL